MAMDVTINIDGARETTLLRLTAEHNARMGSDLSPSQYMRDYVRNTWLDFETQRFKDQDRLSLREAYSQATPAEQAQIDAILAPYR